ncbi:lysM and putative peptidoglycan-binding domain-containing protein 3-like [Mercenaria mercenaria]|uniref:lysM and putative peptidoglycan-binding domain-containing protein 3-like n=1 Tax=Mercenaria mercenaria TaxID=6596 RepID=UPI00234EE5A8|nr:lysM and putative peptidoglycan-binding domain-containing protein 3-like [Mercenaria mercenaria]
MSGKVVRSIFGGQKYEYTRLGEVQNVKKSKVYVFGDDDVAEDDVVEFEMNSVRTRKGKGSHPVQKEDTPSFVERRLTDDDTLQSVSLQYGCPIAEIKRLNNLIRDQDFYALTSVKIPVKQHSFLVDQIQEDDKKVGEKVLKTLERSLSNGAACIDSGDEQSLHYDSETDHTTTDLSDPDTQKQVIREISINKATRSQSKEAVKFLKDMDKDLSHILKTTRTDRNSLDEVISVLTHKSVTPLMMPQRKKSKYLECVIEWRTTVTILVLVAIIAPLAVGIYVLYTRK